MILLLCAPKSRSSRKRPLLTSVSLGFAWGSTIRGRKRALKGSWPPPPRSAGQITAWKSNWSKMAAALSFQLRPPRPPTDKVFNQRRRSGAQANEAESAHRLAWPCPSRSPGELNRPLQFPLSLLFAGDGGGRELLSRSLVTFNSTGDRHCPPVDAPLASAQF